MRCKIVKVERKTFGRVILTIQPEASEAGNNFVSSLENSVGIWTDIEVKNKKKRSLNANAYMWQLCDKLGEKLRSTKEDVYRIFVRDYGVWEDVTGKKEAIKWLMHTWPQHGIGWFCEQLDDLSENMVGLRLYSGSSIYTKSEMSRLIDAIVDECKTQGIETMTPDELGSLLNLMEVNNE